MGKRLPLLGSDAGPGESLPPVSSRTPCGRYAIGWDHSSVRRRRTKNHNRALDIRGPMDRFFGESIGRRFVLFRFFKSHVALISILIIQLQLMVTTNGSLAQLLHGYHNHHHHQHRPEALHAHQPHPSQVRWTKPPERRTYHGRPVDVMTDVINDLGFMILERYVENVGNVGFSPSGLGFVLVALYEGSAGSSSRQIGEVLRLPHDRRITRIGLRDIHRRLRSYLNADAFLGGLTLNRDDINLRPEYEDILRFYGFNISDSGINTNVTSTPSSDTTNPTTDTSSTTDPMTPGSMPGDSTDPMATPMSTPAPSSMMTMMSSEAPSSMMTMMSSDAQSPMMTMMSSDAQSPMTMVVSSDAPSPMTTQMSTDATSPMPTTIDDAVEIITDMMTGGTNSALSVASTAGNPSTNAIPTSLGAISQIVAVTVPANNNPTSGTSANNNSPTAPMMTTPPISRGTSVNNNSPTTPMMTTQPISSGTSANNNSPTTPVMTTQPVSSGASANNNSPTTPMMTAQSIRSVTSRTNNSPTTPMSTIQTIGSATSPNNSPTTPMMSIQTISSVTSRTNDSPTIPITTTQTITSGTSRISGISDINNSPATPMTTTQTISSGTTETNRPGTINNSPTTPMTTREISTVPSTASTMMMSSTVQGGSNSSDVSSTTMRVQRLFGPPPPRINSADMQTQSSTTEDRTTNPTSTSSSMSMSISMGSSDETNVNSSTTTQTETSTITTPENPTTSSMATSVSVSMSMSIGNSDGTTVNSSTTQTTENSTINSIDDTATNSVRKRRGVAHGPAGYFSSSADDGIWLEEFGRSNSHEDYPSQDDDIVVDPRRPTEVAFLVNGCDYSRVTAAAYTAVLPFAYFPSLGASMLEFPLDDPRYKILVMLPSESNGTRRLARLLASKPITLRRLRRSLQPNWITAVIPSFMLRGFVTLTSFLQRLGISDVFEPRAADLSPMSPDLGVYARDIQQSIGVNIRNNVKGGVGGAGDGNGDRQRQSRSADSARGPRGVPPPFFAADRPISPAAARGNDPRYSPYPGAGNVLYEKAHPVPFVVDRSFLYFIVDDETSVTLLAGRIDDPLNSRML